MKRVLATLGFAAFVLLGLCACASAESPRDSPKKQASEVTPSSPYDGIGTYEELHSVYPWPAKKSAPALKSGEQRAEPTGRTKLTLSPDELQEFLALEAEGGAWVDIPATVFANLERAQITPEKLRAYARGDTLVLVDYLRHQNGRWYALMAPYKVVPPTKPGYAGMVVIGFKGFGLVFDEDQARARWRKRQHKLGLPAEQASEVADQLIRFREEVEQTVQFK